MPEFQGKPGGPIRALFERYLLVQFDLANDPWPRVYREPGVASILGPKGRRPSPLPIAALDGLLGQAAINGVVYAAEASPPMPRIAPGATIRVTGGQFAGWEGVCQWSSTRRVAVLLSVMGREAPGELPRAVVAVA